MTDQSKLMLAIMSAIASACTLIAFAAQLFRQDPLLLFVIVVVLAGLGLLTWRLRNWLGRLRFGAIIIIFLFSIVLAVISLVLLANVRVKPVYIAVVEPKDGTQIEGYRSLIKGTVGDANAKVSVVVRSLVSQDYWVQEPPTVDASGTWQVNAHFGESNVGLGEKYEIVSLATNENLIVTWMTGNSLTVGMRQMLPTNTNRSNIVTITRVR